jgi:hypothetical protein
MLTDPVPLRLGVFRTSSTARAARPGGASHRRIRRSPPQGQGRHTAGPVPGVGGRGPGRHGAEGGGGDPGTVCPGGPWGSGSRGPSRGGPGPAREGGRSRAARPGAGRRRHPHAAPAARSPGRGAPRGAHGAGPFAPPCAPWRHGRGPTRALRPGSPGGGGPRGHDKAWGIARAHAGGLAHHAPRLGPGARGRGAGVIETPPGRQGLPRGVGPRAPLGLEAPRRLAGGRGLAQHARLAGAATDHIRPTGGGEPVEDRGGGPRPRATDEEGRGGPVVPQRRPQADHEHGMVGPGGAAAWPAGGRDPGRRRPCDTAARQIAMGLRVMMRARTRVRAIRGRSGVGASEPQGSRGRRGAGDARVHPGACAPREGVAVAVGRQPRARRSTGAGLGGGQGRPRSPELAPGGVAEPLGGIGLGHPAARCERRWARRARQGGALEA